MSAEFCGTCGAHCFQRECGVCLIARLTRELEEARAATRDAETLLRRVSYRQDAPPKWSEECRRAADRLAAVLGERR